MRKTRLMVLLVLVVFALLLGGCATIDKLKTPDKMTHMELAAWANGVYNAQYDDYVARTADPSLLTEEQKKILRAKKKLLTEAHAILMLYSGYVEKGIIPSRELEQMLISIVDRLMWEVLTW